MLIMVLKLQSAFYYFISQLELYRLHNTPTTALAHWILLYISFHPNTQSGKEKRASLLLLLWLCSIVHLSILGGQESKLRFFLSPPSTLSPILTRVCLPDCMRCLYAQQWSILIRFPGTTLCTCIAYHLATFSCSSTIFIWRSRRMESKTKPAKTRYM